MATPTQNVTIEYQAYVDSLIVNRRHRDIRPIGIYKDGYITVESDTSVRIKTMTCEIQSIYDSVIHQVKIDVTVDTVLTGLVAANKYIVARWQYSPIAGDNDMDILAVSLANIQTYDLLIGILEWNAGNTAISSIEYYEATTGKRRSTPEDSKELLKVVPHPSGGRNVMVRYGRVNVGPNHHVVTEDSLALPLGACFVYINSSGGLAYSTSSSYVGYLVLASVSNSTDVDESDITDLRSFISLPNSCNYDRASSEADFTIKDRGVWIDIPSMLVSVTTIGGPILVMYNHEIGTGGDENKIVVRLLLDGTTAIVTRGIKLPENSNTTSADMTTIWPVAAGSHTIKAQVFSLKARGDVPWHSVVNRARGLNDYSNTRTLIALEL